MCMMVSGCLMCFFCKQKTAYEMRISDWSSDVCSSDLVESLGGRAVAIQADSASEPALREAVREAANTLGGLDIFVSNAGILRVGHVGAFPKIGRASCRERVCQYV